MIGRILGLAVKIVLVDAPRLIGIKYQQIGRRIRRQFSAP
tara:strand:+ start:399 stop:518 length:120 start_codon:yes stop_codon:yes gene_type:complete